MIYFVPDKPLTYESLQISQIQGEEKPFCRWSSDNHLDSFDLMRRIAGAWKKGIGTEQYLIYGKQESNVPFKWEIVPYQTSSGLLGRMIGQLIVLWRVVFGGISLNPEERAAQTEHRRRLIEPFPSPTEPLEEVTGDDPFCRQATIEKQWVITGEKVNVLFNYAPIGFGGERLHFLVIPKAHREKFTDLTREEYLESMQLSARIVNHFESTREIKSVYFLGKTGADAGQTVKHFHFHIIFSGNGAQDFFGKLSVLGRILFGATPMKAKELADKVEGLRAELAG